MNKLWANNEQVMNNSWTTHVQVTNKVWTSCGSIKIRAYLKKKNIIYMHIYFRCSLFSTPYWFDIHGGSYDHLSYKMKTFLPKHDCTIQLQNIKPLKFYRLSNNFSIWLYMVQEKPCWISLLSNPCS